MAVKGYTCASLSYHGVSKVSLFPSAVTRSTWVSIVNLPLLAVMGSMCALLSVCLIQMDVTGSTCAPLSCNGVSNVSPSPSGVTGSMSALLSSHL